MDLLNQRFGHEIYLRLGKVLGTPTALAVLLLRNKSSVQSKTYDFPGQGKMGE